MTEKRENSGTWRKIDSREGPDLPLFRVELRTVENPRNQERLKALILHAEDTVNILAIDQQNHVLLVEQFRFGIDAVLMELPAGFIDSGETALQAAQRELLEETGYAGGLWRPLGVSFINPSYVTNRCFHFMAQGVVHTEIPKPDLTEDLKLVRVPLRNLLDPTSPHFPIADAIGRAGVFYAMPYLSRPIQQ